jgi:anti-anti-sigma factor
MACSTSCADMLFLLAERIENLKTIMAEAAINAMQQNANQIHIESRGIATVLDIKGDITATSEASLEEAYQKANAQGAVQIVLKIEKKAYINSGGIAVLIQILTQARRNGQHAAIAGISGHYKKIFKIVGLTNFAEIYDSPEAAMQKLD